MYQSLRYFMLLAILVNSAALAEESGLPAPERLKNDQEAVSGRYARFERLLSQMADILRHEDPDRAELLRRAISKGREQAISTELDVIARRLGEGDYGAAREKQADVESSLLLVLKLLQSEDRRSAVEKERERLNNVLKGIRNTITQERSARSAALNSNAPSNASPSQQKALKSAEEILDDIKKHDDRSESDNGENPGDGSTESGDTSEPNKSPNDDSNSSEAGDPKSSDEGNSEKNSSSDSKPNAGDSDQNADDANEKSDPQEPSDSDSENPSNKSDQKSSSQAQSGEQQDSKQSSGAQQSQPSPSKKSGNEENSSSQPSQPQQDNDAEEQTPGRKQLQQARNLMQEALEQLQQQKREDAVDKQDEAIAELQKAERELEEQLRQLREEEKEMILAALEARFQRLLAQQMEINDNTLDLAATPRDEWLDNAVSRCRDISQQQAELTRECSQTTALLREDGTSVSILVSMEDIETDMGTVSDRLRDTKVFSLTQSIQADIVEALEELIKATQKEMEEMKQNEAQQQQQQSNNSEKPPLVELMAEIRVLRSLQMRVNRRTQQVDSLLEDPEPNDVKELESQLEELTDRQQRLRESAAELAKRMER